MSWGCEEEAGREAGGDTMGGIVLRAGARRLRQPWLWPNRSARQHDRWLCLRVPGWGLNLRHFVILNRSGGGDAGMIYVSLAEEL